MAKETVELYDCKLLHAHNKDHEIPLTAVTARELRLLRAMHGDDALPDSMVKPHLVDGKQATRSIDPKIELFELAMKYAPAQNPMSGKKIVEKTFGTTLVGFDQWALDTIELRRMENEEAMKKRQDEANARRREELRQQAAAA